MAVGAHLAASSAAANSGRHSYRTAVALGMNTEYVVVVAPAISLYRRRVVELVLELPLLDNLIRSELLWRLFGGLYVSSFFPVPCFVIFMLT